MKQDQRMSFATAGLERFARPTRRATFLWRWIAFCLGNDWPVSSGVCNFRIVKALKENAAIGRTEQWQAEKRYMSAESMALLSANQSRS